jgi:hypothetical protein
MKTMNKLINTLEPLTPHSLESCFKDYREGCGEEEVLDTLSFTEKGEQQNHGNK